MDARLAWPLCSAHELVVRRDEDDSVGGAMGALDFAADITRSLSWPLAGIGAVLIMRKPLAGVLDLVHKVKYKDFEVHLGRELTEAETHVSEASRGEGNSIIHDGAWDLADVYPRGAIIEAWMAIEETLATIARERNLEVDAYRTGGSRGLERSLTRVGLVEPELQSALRDLRTVRNRVVHEQDVIIDPESARRYVSVAAQTIGALRQSVT